MAPALRARGAHARCPAGMCTRFAHAARSWFSVASCRWRVPFTTPRAAILGSPFAPAEAVLRLALRATGAHPSDVGVSTASVASTNLEQNAGDPWVAPTISIPQTGEISGLICIDLVNGLAIRFDHVFYPCGTSGSGRGGLRRGLITLIFVGWVPPDLSSSRNCLTLGSWFNAPNGACRIARSRVCPRLPTTLRSRCAELCVGTRQAAARGPSIWRAMAQTKPSSSRAIAAQTFWLGLPRRVRCA